MKTQLPAIDSEGIPVHQGDRVTLVDLPDVEGIVSSVFNTSALVMFPGVNSYPETSTLKIVSRRDGTPLVAVWDEMLVEESDSVA